MSAEYLTAEYFSAEHQSAEYPSAEHLFFILIDRAQIMSLLAFCLRSAFWTRDFFRGAPVRSQYCRTRSVQERITSSDAALLSLLGEEARLSFDYVREIPVLNSGKRKSVVNEWKRM